MKPHTKTYFAAFGYSPGDRVPCEMCGGEAVDVHHITPRSLGGKDVIENLMGLCRQHHEYFESHPGTRSEQRQRHYAFLLEHGLEPKEDQGFGRMLSYDHRGRKILKETTESMRQFIDRYSEEND